MIPCIALYAISVIHGILPIPVIRLRYRERSMQMVREPYTFSHLEGFQPIHEEEDMLERRMSKCVALLNEVYNECHEALKQALEQGLISRHEYLKWFFALQKLQHQTYAGIPWSIPNMPEHIREYFDETSHEFSLLESYPHIQMKMREANELFLEIVHALTCMNTQHCRPAS